MEIYFAHQPESELVKVGISRNATMRLRQLECQLGAPLLLIGLIEGDRHIEKSIHRALYQYRHNGEWYHDCAPVRATIQNCFNNFKKLSQSPVRKNTQFANVARALWPDRTAEKLAEISGSNERTAARWLSGEFEPPGVVIAAVIVEITKRG